MKTYLVSIISEHLLPNYLFIKEMEGKYDDLIFITTSEMIQKANFLEDVLKSDQMISINRIEVLEDQFQNIQKQLNEYGFTDSDNFIVNLTGGTKIMSLSCFNYFSKFKNSSFYYIPVKKNIIINVLTSEEMNLNYRINLMNYLKLYGLKADPKKELYQSSEYTKELFKRYKNGNFNRKNVPELNRKYTDDYAQKYYEGEWFEEYVYQRVKEEQQLEEDKICTGVQLYRENSGSLTDNEIDIMFVKENQLYVGECKMSLNPKFSPEMTKYEKEREMKSNLENYMYKLAAISNDFGIVVYPYIFTLHWTRLLYSSPERKKIIEKRMKILKIKKILSSESFEKDKLEL